MSNPFVARVGGVLSADIAVPEHERALRFYARVLGTGERPLWNEKTLLNNLGIPIIGVGARTAEHAHLPVQWMPHIQVADVAASVRRALERGGRELMHARDDAGTSQWAVLCDPNGAAFGLIPVVPAEALPPLDDAATGGAAVGHIAWLDLTVPDAAATRDFYREVVGWSAQAVEMDDAGEPYADFLMRGGDGEPTAGVCHARGVNRELPSVWMLYLPVGDLDESLRRVEAAGGEVVQARRGDDGVCDLAMVRDPAGAHLALVPGAAPRADEA